MARWRTVLLVAAVTVGCATAVPDPTAPPNTFAPDPTEPMPSVGASSSGVTGSSWPRGDTDVVLRMSEFAPMPAPSQTLFMPPVFTLYGDGRVIYTTQRDPIPAGEALVLHQARLTDQQMAGLLEFALAGGGLANAREEYGGIELSDLGWTFFGVDVDGAHKRVAVYGIGYAGSEPVPDAVARAQLGQLASRLRDFSQDVAAGLAQDAGLFEPSAYRATLSNPNPELVATADWPWPGRDVQDFALGPAGDRSGLVTPAEAMAVVSVPVTANFIVERDGATWAIRLQPLLPDEL